MIQAQKNLANSKEEKITEGLDRTRERLKEYYRLGARFTSGEVFTLYQTNTQSKLSINSNAHALARYAAIAQECGMSNY